MVEKVNTKTYSATFLIDKDSLLKFFDSLICHAVEANKNSVMNICTDTAYK